MRPPLGTLHRSLSANKASPQTWVAMGGANDRWLAPAD
jgi:hypothetical protein